MTMVHTSLATAETAHGTGETVQRNNVDVLRANSGGAGSQRDLRRMTRLQQGQRVLHAVSLGLCGIAGGALAFGITAHPDFLMSSGLICIGMLSIGCVLFWGAETWFQSELVIDPHRQEIRILRRHPSGRQDIVMKRGFGSLSGVAIGTRDLTVMDRNGQRVAHYVVPDQKMLAELRCTLGQHLQVLP